ncbi:MAG: Rieske 2Fe-2S domain-containing protein [Verrucomicrobia bacterium]|nr:Rieske 2Fe-2S domain-containing protein [Verrucomicrobiota bacterium]
MMTVAGADRPVLLCWHEGVVFALDDRCPHMGFPLAKGSVRDGILTCHWHHARFDLRSGCTFDLWADDTPSFEVRVEGENVWVARQLRQKADAAFYAARLRRGLEQGIGLIQAKGIVALLAQREPVETIVGQVAEFGARHRRTWRDGMTLLTIAARLSSRLSETTRVYVLALAARTVGQNCAGQAPRYSPGGFGGECFDEDRLSRWMFHWAKVRHDDGAERTLLTALESGLGRDAVHRLVFGPLQARIYADSGHALDLSNKAFELLEVIGWQHAAVVLPLIVENLTQSQSEEESGSWRAPTDLIELIRAAEDALRAGPKPVKSGGACRREFYRIFLGEDPRAILGAITEAVRQGTSPEAIARHLALAAAWRLACFPESNDIADWFAPMHTFSFCHALHQVLGRSEGETELVRGLFHAAMSIYTDRFLNIPRAPLPGERPLDQLPDTPDEFREAMLSALDQRRGWAELPRLVTGYLRRGHPEEGLIDALAFGTVREDLDFHMLQVLDAGITEAATWPQGCAERELLYAAVARHLAAHCPTTRSSGQAVAVALRLHRGDELHAG